MKRITTAGMLLVLFVLVGQTGAAGGDIHGKKSERVQHSSGSPSRTHFDINRLQTPFWSNGISDFNYYRVGDAGLIYPKGSAKSAIYAAGFWWSARFGPAGDLRSGGVNYYSGLRCGKILPGMIAESDGLPKSRIYRVRRDFPPGNRSADVRSEQLDGEGASDEIYAQYHKDWLEWPWLDGAPFDDLNGNGSYEPDADIPGVKGADQTIWFVANDLDAAIVNDSWGCNPMGIEMQMTAWGYAREDALGNMLFRKYLLINKSTTPFDSMFAAMWTDPDLGNPGDDLVGCDTSRSLGFVYNGLETDILYAPLPPPSVGFDFFQGPAVPGLPTDSAIFLGKRIYGKRNLPMAAFFAFDYSVPDASYWDPDYQIPQQINNVIRGFTKSGKPWRTPDGSETKFPFTGDPGTQTGWLDGQLFPRGDRRFGLSTGPFTMAPGDTQEIVVAEIAAGAELGTDRLTAVSLLKFYDDQAQLAYDNFFELPTPPLAPNVTVTGLDREVVLSWGDDRGTVATTENVNIKGYAFQGYNVYQLPSASAAVSEGMRLATYDIVDDVQKIRDRAFDPVQGEVVTVVKQFGTDNGISRYMRIKTDPFTNNNPLVNGTPYHYAVTAYSYNPDPLAVPRTMENPLKVYTVYPHAPDPGFRYSTSSGDTLQNVVHTSTAPGGTVSNGRVIAQVVNPSLLRRATYKVVISDIKGSTVWHLVRTEGAATDTLVKNMTDQTGSDATSPIVDGILFRVFTVTPDFVRFVVVSNGSGALNPPDMGAFAFNSSGFPTLDGDPPDDISNDRPSSRQQVGGGQWGITTGEAGLDGNYTFDVFKSRTTRNGAKWPLILPFDFEIRFTAGGCKGEMAYSTGTIVDLPFELWNIGISTPNDPADDFKMIPWINDVNENERFDLDSVDHSVSGGDNDPETDWIYWMNPANTSPGTTGYDAWVTSNFDDAAAVGPEVMARMVLVNWNGGSVGDPSFPANVNQQVPEVGTVFRILTSKPNRPGDVFTVTPPANSYNPELARSDISAINVFPNPYYGANPQEQDKYARFVTFSHLPPRATIRIFNLAGVMVRRIDRNSSSQFERWDLKNEDGLPVGSGMYIAHIEMPDLGVNKILKIAVVQEQQILDRY